MVKKRYTSKRTTLKDKYKIQKRTKETHRKAKKEARRDAAKGIVKHSNKSKKDPGIPNSWPFKEDLLNDIKRSKEALQLRQRLIKDKRSNGLKLLKSHQEDGGTARTVQELLEQAQQKQGIYNMNGVTNDKQDLSQLQQQQKRGKNNNDNMKKRSNDDINSGQSSRRAYLRELKKVIDESDIILQVLDARDPISSRIHPSIENIILSNVDKKMVLVLNKIDLVPKSIISSWLTYLRKSHPTIAIKASTQFTANPSSSNTASIDTEQSTVPVGMDGLLQLLKNYARTGGTGGKSKTTIVVGIIGYPNVGKSSIINALKRCRAVTVSSRPGCTTSMQEVVLDKNVRLLDSPGIVFSDSTSLLGNCVDIESVIDPIPHVTALLSKCNYNSLLMTYNIPSFPVNDTMAFLGLIAKSYGRVLKGGIPDKVGAARAIIKDWNNGKIPYYTVPPVISSDDNNNDTMTDNGTGTSSKNKDAVIVSKFSAEFDLSKFDAELFDDDSTTMKARDEMDYIKIEQQHGTTNNNAIDEATMQDAVNYLLRGDDNEEDDDENNDGEDDDDEDFDDVDDEEEEDHDEDNAMEDEDSSEDEEVVVEKNDKKQKSKVVPVKEIKNTTSKTNTKNNKKSKTSQLKSADDYDFSTM